MALKKVEKRRKNISFIILLIVCIIFMIPLIWAIATSFKTTEDITFHITSLIPYHFTPKTDLYLIFIILRLVRLHDYLNKK